MNVKEIRSLGAPELQEKMGELYKELMKDNAQVATGTAPKNPDKLKRAKKTIAQIKTILHERETGKTSLSESPIKKEVAKKA